MKINKIAALTALSVALAGCSNDFFDLNPHNEVPANEFYVTASDFDLAAIGCYAKLQSQVNFYTECAEFRSDNIYLSAPTTGTQDRYDIDQFQDRPSNELLLDFWDNFNNGVYRCNKLLDQIDGASFDETLKKQYKGEALFIRALTYFNMYRTWGGVPTTKRAVSIEESYKIGRSTPEQMYELIAGDLRAIIDGELLPASYSASNAGRATIGAARALLGKVYLTFHKWTEARDVLAGVIDQYVLETEPGAVFDVENKNSREIIFAVRFSKTVVGEGHGFWFQTANLSDDKGQTDALENAFTTGDKRKELIAYVKVPGESSVCVPRKFLDTRDATTKSVGNDQILLRYADVLLMYAEALNEIGFSNAVDAPAMKALNAVRVRAGLGSVSPGNQTAFRRAILDERQKEFPYEGQRWFDLVRMGYANEMLTAAEGHEVADYQLVYPIPQSAIERVNDNKLLWQNEGY